MTIATEAPTAAENVTVPDHPLKYFTASFFNGTSEVWREIVNLSAISETELRSRLDDRFPPETRVAPVGFRPGPLRPSKGGIDSLVIVQQPGKIEVHDFLNDGRAARSTGSGC